jgi:nucleoside-diphosphate-sugar epimerase
MVLASSVSVYGGSDRGCLNDNSPCQPAGDYAESKARAEQVALHISQDSGLPTIVLRFPAIYGAGDSGNIYRLMKAIDLRRFVWVGTGENLKSLIHVQDAARACVYAVQRVRSCPIPLYNVVGHTSTIREIATILSEELQAPLSSWRLPVAPFIGALKIARLLGSQWSNDMLVIVNKWLSEDFVDGSRFEKDFGFHPAVSLVNGLRQEVAWYRDAPLTQVNPLRRAA